MLVEIFLIGIIAVQVEVVKSDPSEFNVLVNISSGTIHGSFLKTRKNQTILSFRGIKYAEPPIGENRFRPPVPVKPWSDIFDATKDGPICPQPYPMDGDIMSEDCLVLNIYTKNLTGNEPVLVFIHGGGFVIGSGNSKFVGPQYLLDKEIVLVSINYRLGAFGFLRLGTKEASGNYGFKDQVLALKWVKENIRNFGGNPDLVTICGHSAGAMSVTLHMVSPMSRGLFHRAIPMSGSSMSHVHINNTFWTQKLVNLFNCTNTSVSDVIICLRNIPFEKIVTACEIFNLDANLIILTWNYEIEKETIEVEPFITEDPTKTLRKGNFSRVPVMTGITKDEFSYRAQIIYRTPSLLTAFNENFDEIGPYFFSYEDGTNRSKIISSTLRSFYLNDSNVTDENIKSFENLFSDSHILYGVHRFVSIARNFVNVFYYQQNYIGRFSFFYRPDGKPDGVVHGDDLQYLMVFNGIGPMLYETDSEIFMVERMTSWWTWFARTGPLSGPGKTTPTDLGSWEEFLTALVQYIAAKGEQFPLCVPGHCLASHDILIEMSMQDSLTVATRCETDPVDLINQIS